MTEREPSATSDVRTVLHVACVDGGGVASAVSTYAAVTPHLEHRLLCSSLEGIDEQHFSCITLLPAGRLRRWRAVRKAVAHARVDVVHAHSSLAGGYLRLGMKRLRPPTVYQPHAYSFEGGSAGSLRRWAYRVAERLLARRTDLVAILSPREDELARGLSRRVPRAEVRNVSVVPTGQHSGRGDNDRVVVTIGRISPQKAPDFFAELAEIVDAEWVWIGDGEPALRRRLEEVGVRVTGWCSQAEVGRELSRASAYFHGAAYEGFPIAVLDATAAGVPVVLRERPYSKGIALLQGSSRDEIRTLLEEVLEDGHPTRSRAVELGKQLNESHSPANLRRDLTELYSRAVEIGRETLL